jgi:hypothetical protein
MVTARIHDVEKTKVDVSSVGFSSREVSGNIKIIPGKLLKINNSNLAVGKNVDLFL